MYQKPWLARNSSGIFVVARAVVITINSGTADALVPSPRSTKRPHTRRIALLREQRIFDPDIDETYYLGRIACRSLDLQALWIAPP
jgi:hypothetical protein